MRIIFDEDLCPVERDCHICDAAQGLGTEIADEEWDEIVMSYADSFCFATIHDEVKWDESRKPFSQYLKELISLAREER